MTDRIPLDDMTSDQLDALYVALGATRYDLGKLRETHDRLWREFGKERARAEQAEVERNAIKRAHVALAEQAGKDQAALERVRRLADRWHNQLLPHSLYARDLRAALDEHQEQ